MRMRPFHWVCLGVAALLIVILGRLLLPGYVLSLDMIFTPDIPHPVVSPGSFANALPIKWVWYILSLAVPGWVVQKLVFIGLFTALPLIAYCFLLPKKSFPVARAWAAVFFTINPFVYTRFLAGHWTHLVAYALFPLILHVALQVVGLREGKRTGWRLGALLALTCVFSLHLGVMAMLMVAAIGVYGLTLPERARIARAGAMAGGVVGVVSSYWLVPYLLHPAATILTYFDPRHWEAYRTVGGEGLGLMGNVLALYGFWGEAQPWAQQFLWAKDIPFLLILSAVCLLGLGILGARYAFRPTEDRREAMFMAAFMVWAFVCSCGLGEGPFRPFNLWLFEHISWWRGFRDTQKWSAVLALGYAFFGGMGIAHLVRMPWNIWVRRGTIALGFLAVFAYTWPMLGGFWGQLKPVTYPTSWAAANEIFKQDDHCKALFLPWHQYLSYGFTNGVLVANPARDYFDCTMLTSRQVELGVIDVQTLPDPAHDALDALVIGKDNWTPEEAVKILKEVGIRYVIVSKDMIDADPFTYGFLDAPSLHPVATYPDLVLYRVE